MTGVDVSILSLLEGSLPKSTFASGEKPAVSYFDYVIDGVALRPLLATENIGVLSNEWDSVELARHLLGEGSISHRIEDRALIYGCAVCLDVECGGITAEITRVGNHIRWDKIETFEIDWGGDCSAAYTPTNIGPFTFDYEQYRAALAPFLAAPK